MKRAQFSRTTLTKPRQECSHLIFIGYHLVFISWSPCTSNGGSAVTWAGKCAQAEFGGLFGRTWRVIGGVSNTHRFKNYIPGCDEFCMIGCGGLRLWRGWIYFRTYTGTDTSRKPSEPTLRGFDTVCLLKSVVLGVLPDGTNIVPFL
jgi:hypothetical protein